MDCDIAQSAKPMQPIDCGDLQMSLELVQHVIRGGTAANHAACIDTVQYAHMNIGCTAC